MPFDEESFKKHCLTKGPLLNGLTAGVCRQQVHCKLQAGIVFNSNRATSWLAVVIAILSGSFCFLVAVGDLGRSPNGSLIFLVWSAVYASMTHSARK